MRSVGVIGGLGPETTAEFYLEVIFRCQQMNQVERPLIAISSVPLLLDIERDLITSNTGKERYIPFLTKEAKRLEHSGVDFLVMPCNSLHVFIEHIRNAVAIPVLSIVEETIAFMKAQSLQHVGLISTSATLANNVYETALTENSLRFTAPDHLQRAQLDKVIQNLVHGRHLAKDRELIMKIIKDLSSQDVDCVALACTDLQLLLPEKSTVPLFDTMKILAESTSKRILD